MSLKPKGQGGVGASGGTHSTRQPPSRKGQYSKGGDGKLKERCICCQREGADLRTELIDVLTTSGHTWIPAIPHRRHDLELFSSIRALHGIAIRACNLVQKEMISK